MSFEKMMDTIQTAAGGFRRRVAGASVSASRHSGEEFLWRRDSPNIILWTTTASRKAARGIAASTL